MISFIIGVTRRRFFELLFTNAILSVIVTALNVIGIISTRATLFLGTFLGTVIFICLNVRMMRHCYFDLRSSSIYLLTNVSAYFVFAAVYFAIYVFCPNEFYTWMFAITKFAKYINHLSTLESAIVFHCIGLIAVFVAPLGMGWIFEE